MLNEKELAEERISAIVLCKFSQALCARSESGPHTFFSNHTATPSQAASASSLANWKALAMLLSMDEAPLLISSQTIPIVAIAPLMIIWFGFGLLPKILVVALVTFFPVTIGLVDGFACADREASALLRSMGAGRIKEFLFLRLPSALPLFFTSLRIGITYAVVGAIFAEYVGAKQGLGIYMSVQKNAFRTDLVLAAVAVAAAISIVLYLSTYLVERAVIPWHIKERTAANER